MNLLGTFGLVRLAILYGVVLGIVAVMRYVPGVEDAQGRTLGIFVLDPFDDALHAASALWSLASAYVGASACRRYFRIFGVLYALDGLMGLIVGVGYLDAGILVWGPQDLPLAFKILANLPHLTLGGLAILAGFGLAGPDRR